MYIAELIAKMATNTAHAKEAPSAETIPWAISIGVPNSNTLIK